MFSFDICQTQADPFSVRTDSDRAHVFLESFSVWPISLWKLSTFHCFVTNLNQSAHLALIIYFRGIRADPEDSGNMYQGIFVFVYVGICWTPLDCHEFPIILGISWNIHDLFRNLQNVSRCLWIVLKFLEFLESHIISLDVHDFLEFVLTKQTVICV